MLVAASLAGCFPAWSGEPLARLYLGRYEVGPYEVDWCHHSDISDVTEPVVVYRTAGTAEDTLAQSFSIYDITADGDTLPVHSCRPVVLNSPADLPVEAVVSGDERCKGRL